MADKIRILVVDDHFIVRIGLLSLMNTEPNLLVVGEAGDGAEAIRQYKTLRPDLAVMDLRLPDMDGHEVARQIRMFDPQARILIISAFEGDADIHAALEAGACGYVLKSVTGEELIPAIHAVAQGRRWIPQEVASRLRSRNTYEELTAREHEVLVQLARGLANKEIADTLGITEHTTKGHLKSILGKLRVLDRTQAVIAAVQRGLIHY
ncbi:MAG TPA: response regulator transcription factor [Candidatus Didemnitutus sp.]|nr:response regulator transcription factor [Candidatus Didemnitutus sp.]